MVPNAKYATSFGNKGTFEKFKVGVVGNGVYQSPLNVVKVPFGLVNTSSEAPVGEVFKGVLNFIKTLPSWSWVNPVTIVLVLKSKSSGCVLHVTTDPSGTNCSAVSILNFVGNILPVE